MSWIILSKAQLTLSLLKQVEKSENSAAASGLIYQADRKSLQATKGFTYLTKLSIQRSGVFLPEMGNLVTMQEGLGWISVREDHSEP